MSTILIVEDEPEISALLKKELNILGYKVTTATSVNAALNLLTPQPDLILLDIMLPGGLNGFDLLERLKADPKTHNIPVIIVTNLDSEEKVAKDIGATKYFVKSKTSLDSMVKQIHEILKPQA